MPGPFHGLLYIKDRTGNVHEIINQARTDGYLRNPALSIANGSAVCDIYDLAECATYDYFPQCNTDDGWIEFPGTTNNYASTPDATALDITGDISFAARIAPDDWTPSAAQVIIAKNAQADPNRSYSFTLLATGNLAIQWATAGTTATQVLSTSSATLSSLANGKWKWVGAILDVDNGSSLWEARYFTSDDGVTWTALGTTQTGSPVTSIFNSTAAFTIGGYAGGAGSFDGKISYARVAAGIDAAKLTPLGGTERFRFSASSDLDNMTASVNSLTVASAQVLTINRAGSPATVVQPTYTETWWRQMTFNTPATDPAPWYSASYPESADALGFIVEEWTGLDDAHVKRSSTPWDGAHKGSSLAAISAVGRTMSVNLLLLGRNEEAVEYLFRWLASTLTGVCQTCASDSILLRRTCGTTVTPWNGMSELRRVGLTQGLTWESEPLTRAVCWMRRANFTLMAGDPCMYSLESLQSSAPTFQQNIHSCFTGIVGVDSTRVSCRPMCSEIYHGNCRYTFTMTGLDSLGAMAPIVTWSNPSSQYTFPFRAIVYGDPTARGSLPNPCGLPILGEIYVRALPPDTWVQWDVVGRDVRYRNAETGGWTSGWAFVEPNDPPRQRFFALPCGTAHLIMEPASMCATFVSGSAWTLDGITYDPPTFPAVADLSLQERLSCA